jgi:hypothetical protein
VALAITEDGRIQAVPGIFDHDTRRHLGPLADAAAAHDRGRGRP